MNRRDFLKNLGVKTAGGVAMGFAAGCGFQASPAVPDAEAISSDASLPEINWQMATSWPVALDTIYGGAQVFAERVGAMTGGKFTITPRAAGELAPGLEVLNVVEEGSNPVLSEYFFVWKIVAVGLTRITAVSS
ncbi:MAG: twin-arginine translocation signal domain-containing protein, partial [Chloroflexota bacterium]